MQEECDCGDVYECSVCFKREQQEKEAYLEAQADNELMRWKEER